MAEKINILYEDEHILVCRKRAGLAVQSAGITAMDLESLLRNELARRGQGKGSPAYLAVVHRLDQPVEGLLVFAKDAGSASALSAQVQDGRMKKEYLAISCPTEKGEALAAALCGGEEKRLEDYLVKDAKTHMARITREKERGAKRAVLYVSRAEGEVQSGWRGVPEDGREPVLLYIRLVTGRYHQIRAQLSHAGLPIAGDRRYGGETKAGDGSALPYPALCACALSFVHPVTGRQMAFRIRPSFLESM